MLQRMIAGAAVLFAAVGIAHAETTLERGSYLVNAVMACDGCHTPRGPSGFVMDKRFSGGSQSWDTPAYTVRGSNITPDRETGIGEWSAVMPFAFYRILTVRDLDAVVAYLRSLPSVRNEVAPPVYKAPMHVELVPGAVKPFTEEALAWLRTLPPLE